MTTILHRIVQLPEIMKKKSHFLFGPRSCGKTFLITQQFKGSSYTYINLLQTQIFFQLTQSPWELENFITKQPAGHIVIIDEIQKIPPLLDEVHRLIEEKNYHFLLTGSSARKLKKAGVNLLGGRARKIRLFGLTSQEMGDFNLLDILRYGSLPKVFLEKDPNEKNELLFDWAQSYLKDEIMAESLVRNLPPFNRFLLVAGLEIGHTLNYSNIASDCGVSHTTIRSYFDILEDTLIGTRIESWSKSVKRKAIGAPKFYLFDTGVACTLAQTKTLEFNSDLFGHLFENFIATELLAYISYNKKHIDVCYWRTQDHLHEVDFVLGDICAIEVKATKRVTQKDLKGLKALMEENILQKYYIISNDSITQSFGDIVSIHYKMFLEQLWNHQII